MGKLPYGQQNAHVKASRGGDVDVMKFYCTQYGTDYGRRFANFDPREGGLSKGSGFVSNQRPVIFYSAHLDEYDNPAMGRIVAENYSSITRRSYLPLDGVTGKEPLPGAITQGSSGYVRTKPLHIPTESEVSQLCIGSSVGLAPVDILPRHKPILHAIQRKDPIEAENFGYGPGCMTTETKTRFRGDHPTANYSPSSIGPMTETGYTHNHTVEPITFYDDRAFQGDCEDYMTDRPTGWSITKTHYQPSMLPNGLECLPKIAIRSNKESGYTHRLQPQMAARSDDAYDRAEEQPGMKLDRIKKADPMEYINMTNPNNRSSVNRCTMLGKQLPDETIAERLGNLSVGRKEETGYTDNNAPFQWSADNPARFITDNMAKFHDTRPMGTDRQGHVWGGTQPPLPDGFTRSTSLHTGGADYNPNAVLRNVDPYVSKSIRARDQYFEDNQMTKSIMFA